MVVIQYIMSFGTIIDFIEMTSLEQKQVLILLII